MTDARPRRAIERRIPTPAAPLRLDLLVNPYGPSMRVLEALASGDELHLPHPDETERLRRRIAELQGVPATWVVLGNGIDELVVAALGLVEGPAVLFPPSDPDQGRIVGASGREAVVVPRSYRFAIEVDPATFTLPPKAIGLALTPNDPTGTILSPQEAVRLSRRCALLVIDERHAAYSPRTLLPLAREFENIVVLRTFETWAGLSGLPVAYAIAPPRLAARLNERRLRHEIAFAAVCAAHATLDDLPLVTATVERIRDEKARLYRTLRKLNMVRPYPSWANFLMARVERGDRAMFARELAARGIAVHLPEQPELVDFIRISATTAEATTMLKNALIEAAAGL